MFNLFVIKHLVLVPSGLRVRGLLATGVVLTSSEQHDRTLIRDKRAAIGWQQSIVAGGS
jgi:hypothetical protein